MTEDVTAEPRENQGEGSQQSVSSLDGELADQLSVVNSHNNRGRVYRCSWHLTGFG